MAQNTCCSRTHKTAPQLEPPYCRYRPAVISISCSHPEKKGEFINSAPFLSLFPTLSFSRMPQICHGYSHMGSHILIIYFMHFFFFWSLFKFILILCVWVSADMFFFSLLHSGGTFIDGHFWGAYNTYIVNTLQCQNNVVPLTRTLIHFYDQSCRYDSEPRSL